MEVIGPNVNRRRAAWHQRGDMAGDLWREVHMHTVKYQQCEQMWEIDLSSLSRQTAAHLQANHQNLLEGMLASAGPDICFLELQRSLQESRYKDFQQAGGVASADQWAEAQGHSGVYNPDLSQWGGTQWEGMGPDQDSNFEDQMAAFDGILRSFPEDDSDGSGDGSPTQVEHMEELDILATEIRSGEDPYEGIEDSGRGPHGQHRVPLEPPARESPVPPPSTRESVRLLRQRAAEAQRLAEQAEAALDMEQLQAEQSTLQEQYLDSVRHDDRAYSEPSGNTPSSYDGEAHPNYYSSTGSDDIESLYTWERDQNQYDREERNRGREENAAAARAEAEAAAQPTAESSENSSAVEETEVSQWRSPLPASIPLPNPDYRQAVPTSAQPTGVEPAMVPQAGLGRAGVGSSSTHIPYGVGCGDRDTPVQILHTPSVTPDREAPVGGQSEDSRRTATVASASTRNQDTLDRFFRLPNAVEAEFMANNPEEVELMWQEDIVLLPPAGVTGDQRAQCLWERYLAGYDSSTRVVPQGIYTTTELQQVLNHEQELTPEYRAHRFIQHFQGRTPFTAAAFGSHWQRLSCTDQVPVVVPLAPSRVEALRRDRDTRAREPTPTRSGGPTRRSRFDGLTGEGPAEPLPPAIPGPRAPEAGEQAQYTEQAQAYRAETAQHVVAEVRGVESRGTPGADQGHHPQFHQAPVVSSPEGGQGTAPSADPSLESMMRMMAEAHAAQAKHMTDLTKQMTGRMQAMEIAASAAEEIRIATAEAVRKAAVEAAREATEQRASATAAATATAEAAAHEVGRQQQIYMRDLRRQQREEMSTATAERQQQMVKRETELTAEKEAVAEDRAHELRREEEETDATNQRVEEETAMAAMSAEAERIRSTERSETTSYRSGTGILPASERELGQHGTHAEAIAKSQHAYLSKVMTVTASDLGEGEQRVVIQPHASVSPTTLFYSGLVVQPTEGVPQRLEWALEVKDGNRMYLIDGAVSAVDAEGHTIPNMLMLAKMNEYIHDPLKNACRFEEHGVVWCDQISAGLGDREVYMKYDFHMPGDDLGRAEGYAWSKPLARLMGRLATVLCLASIKLPYDNWPEKISSSEHFASVLAVVEQLEQSGDMELFYGIVDGTVDAETPVQADVALLLQAVEGNYEVGGYYEHLSGAPNHEIPIDKGVPSVSMLPHILLCLPVVMKEIQFRVADDPTIRQPEGYKQAWTDILVLFAASTFNTGRVDVSQAMNRALEKEIETERKAGVTRARKGDDGGDGDDSSTSSTLRTTTTIGSGHSQGKGPIRSPSVGSRQSDAPSRRLASMLRAPAPSPGARVTTGTSEKLELGVTEETSERRSVWTWDGYMSSHLRGRLGKDGFFLHLKKNTIPDASMATMRRAKGGLFAKPYITAAGHMTKFTGAKGELVCSWLVKALTHMRSNQYYYTVLAADLKEGKLLQGRALEIWLEMMESIEFMWEDVLEPQVALDTSAIEAGVQYLEDMILLYLVTFTDKNTPSTTTAIQNAINTATMKTKNIGGAYNLYKSIIHLLEQLVPGIQPPYDTVFAAVQRAMHRSGENKTHGVDMAITLAKAVRQEDSDRRLAGGGPQATHARKLGMLRQACSRLTDEHKLNSVHLHEAVMEEVAPQRSSTPEKVKTEQVKTLKTPPASPDREKEGARAPQSPGQAQRTPWQRQFKSVATIRSLNFRDNVQNLHAECRGMCADEANEFMTYSRKKDAENIIALINAIEACEYLQTSVAIQAISLTDSANNCKFSEEPAQRLQLTRCTVCGYVGHDAAMAASQCRFANSKCQFLLDAMSMVHPDRRSGVWGQACEFGILKGLPQADIDQLWEIVLEKIEAREDQYRKNNPLSRGPYQMPSQARNPRLSPYTGSGGRGRFGERTDEGGNPLSLRDPRRRPQAPIVGAQWAQQRGPSQDSRFNRSPSPGAQPPSRGRMEELTQMRKSMPTYPYLDKGGLGKLNAEDPMRSRVVIVATKEEAHQRSGVPLQGTKASEGSHITVPPAAAVNKATVPRVEGKPQPKAEGQTATRSVAFDMEQMEKHIRECRDPVTPSVDLWACGLSDEDVEAVRTIWEAGPLNATARLTFHVKPRAPTPDDYGWTRKPTASRQLTIAEAERYEYMDTTPKIGDTGASMTVCSRDFVKKLGGPLMKRGRFRANMANSATGFGDEYTVLIIAFTRVDENGRECVQEVGVQALVLTEVQNELLIGDSTLSQINAVLHLKQGCMTMLDNTFQTFATKWRPVENEG
ncbi:hypothetical protein B484DRAFT_469418 [Ochromonadaceae sp. CCMP2298]|nr:hypothetical protein B484DRAFT_469418 [Ochromonadaceae sp. CCMP2298]